MTQTITRKQVSERLLAYLNEEITLPALVAWAEDAVAFADLEPDEDVDLLMDILMYLGAADPPGFPLTWHVLLEFLGRLGTRVRVVERSA